MARSLLKKFFGVFFNQFFTGLNFKKIFRGSCGSDQEQKAIQKNFWMNK